jgi:hypothetical protein
MHKAVPRRVLRLRLDFRWRCCGGVSSLPGRSRTAGAGAGANWLAIDATALSSGSRGAGALAVAGVPVLALAQVLLQCWWLLHTQLHFRRNAGACAGDDRVQSNRVKTKGGNIR